MLDFKKLKGYPMLHIIEHAENGNYKIQFTHTEDPKIGDEVITPLSHFKPGIPSADIIEIISADEPKSIHHKEAVMLYTCLIAMRPIVAVAA